jgi:hypothetical protein
LQRLPGGRVEERFLAGRNWAHVSAEPETELDGATALRWTVGIGAFTGLWGVITGFAIFVLMRTESSDPLTFMLGLGSAAIASFVIESLREAMRGEVEVHPTRRVAHYIVTIVTLLVLELFVLASHNAVDILRHPADVAELRNDLLGPALIGTPGAGRDLVVLAFLWAVAGATVGGFLGLFVARERTERPSRERFIAGGRTGALVALTAAPVAVFAYILVWRTVVAFRLAGDPSAWDQNFTQIFLNISNTTGSSIPGIPGLIIFGGLFAVAGIVKLWVWSPAGKLIDVALLAGVIFVAVRFKRAWPIGVIVAGFAIIIVAPLFLDLKDLGIVALLTIIVWIVPGTVLGFAAPLLERPSERANWWSAIAATLALIVGVLTVLRWHELGARGYAILAIAIVFLVVALLFVRLRNIDEFWPALALCLATIATGLSFLLVNAAPSFNSVLGVVMRINALPATVAPSQTAIDRVRHLHELDADLRVPFQQRFDPLWKGPFETKLAGLPALAPAERGAAIETASADLRQKRATAMDAIDRLNASKRAYLREHAELDAAIMRASRPAPVVTAAPTPTAGPNAETDVVQELLHGSSPARPPLSPRPRTSPRPTVPPALTAVPKPVAEPTAYLHDPLYASLDGVDELSGAALGRRLEADLDLAMDRAYGDTASIVALEVDDAPADARYWRAYADRVRLLGAQVESIDAVLADLAASAHSDAQAEQRARDVSAAESKWYAAGVPEQLEVALAGSFAFWVTVGLLSGWAIRRRRAQRPAPAASATVPDAGDIVVP